MDFPGRREFKFVSDFDIWETTLKGPYLLGESLGVVLLRSCRLVPSSQTFEPTVNRTYHSFSFIQDSCALHWASWVAFLVSLMDESCVSREGMVVFQIGWCTWGVYPMSKLYSVFLVVADGHEFLVY